MKLSIIIPAYNEENRITRTLDHYARYFQELENQHALSTEIVVVLNGCKDNTLGVVQAVAQQYPMIRIVELKQAGKGLAIAAGFKDALTRSNDLIGFVDADMATSPDQFNNLVDALKSETNYDGVIASRYMPGAKLFPPRPFIKRWGSKLIYENMIRLLFGMNYYDYQCGAKLFRRAVIQTIAPQLTVTQWAFDVEVLYLCKKHNYKILEIPTIWYDQADSKLKIMRSGFRMLSALVRMRINHSRFNKMNHKPI